MNDDLVEAINDLTRVMIALNGGFSSKSEAIRRLHELSIPSGRIAAILAVNQNDVTSAIAKFRKAAKAGSGGNRG
ncbi:MAG: hypothetical protein AABO58_23940 [Acidobacteriota bacterium]